MFYSYQLLHSAWNSDQQFILWKYTTYPISFSQDIAILMLLTQVFTSSSVFYTCQQIHCKSVWTGQQVAVRSLTIISLPYWTPVSHIHSIIKCPVSGGWYLVHRRCHVCLQGFFRFKIMMHLSISIIHHPHLCFSPTIVPLPIESALCHHLQCHPTVFHSLHI